MAQERPVARLNWVTQQVCGPVTSSAHDPQTGAERLILTCRKEVETRTDPRFVALNKEINRPQRQLDGLTGSDEPSGTAISRDYIQGIAPLLFNYLA